MTPEPTAKIEPGGNVGDEAPLPISTTPPVLTVSPLMTPPDSISSVPPALTIVPLAVPPNSTTCTPPANTVAPLARPRSNCVPPEICAALSVPPDRMVRRRHSKFGSQRRCRRNRQRAYRRWQYVVVLAMPPDTISEPPLDTVVLLAMPPDSTTPEPANTMVPLA